MNVIPTKISGLLILEPKVFQDERGFFMESFNQASFNEAVGEEVVFVQDNHSKSSKGVLRGMHYHLNLQHRANLFAVQVALSLMLLLIFDHSQIHMVSGKV